MLVGTDERDHPKISADEITYLCAAVNGYFSQQISADSVISTYSGVRPLYDDGSKDAKAITRDYVLKLGRDSGPQVLSIFGGKLTTYRRLAEHALEMLAPFLPPMQPPWTGTAALPGGDLAAPNFAQFLGLVRVRWPFLDPDVAERMAHAYGSRLTQVLGEARAWGDLGEDFGSGLSEAELRYLVRHEWARTPQDVLWRRTKLGLTASPETVRKIESWLDQHL